MRIVVLNHRDLTHPEAGGAEVYLHEIFERIAARGHRVTLLCAGYRGARRGGRIGNVDVQRVGTQATFQIVGTLAALRMARREGVQVIVESLCKVPFLVPAFSEIPVLPVVLHLFGTTAFRELSPPLASYVWLSEKLIPRVYRGLPFVALSQSTARDLQRRGVVPSTVEIIPPGLDLSVYSANGSHQHTEPLLVYVGRLKRYKGLDFVLRAFVHVREAVPGARFVVVGKGKDRRRLERLARSLGLGDAVHFTGYVSEDRKVEWLQRAHAAVYPSPKEGWGIATMEAAACGTPVLASDADGLRDAVRDGSTGLLLPHGDVGRWATSMIEVLQDHTLRQRLSNGAHAWAGEFSWEVQAEKMYRIVDAVATRSHVLRRRR